MNLWKKWFHVTDSVPHVPLYVEKIGSKRCLAYAHGLCHLFGAVWKQIDFKKSDGTPIQHSEQICQFIYAMMLPKRRAIIKCQAHKKGNYFVIKREQCSRFRS